MKAYLGNAFSLNMLPLSPGDAAEICIEKLELGEFKLYVGELMKQEKLECVIGHASTAELAAKLLGVAAQELRCERKAIILKPGETLYAVTLAFRPEEGKVYSIEELEELYKQGRIAFWAVHYGPC